MALPSWQFPPTNGGIDFVQDPSSGYFRGNPVPNLVREVIQNSLDAQEKDLSEPVAVRFCDTNLDKTLIGASELEPHLRECLKRAESTNRKALIASYQRSLNALASDSVRCLSVVDSGTTGLKGRIWDALVIQEGAVEKDGAAPGGSNGIGKNSVLNVSDLRTVFYSTQYLGRRGKVEKMQGKATLMCHPDPHHAGQQLQHIGFYKSADGPLNTREIPDVFRIADIGTGVFIMGFNPRSENWIDTMVASVVENFFFAIHHQNLVITISSQSRDEITVSHETIDQLFQSHALNSPARCYYQAIRDGKPGQTPKFDRMGVLDAYIATGAGMPRRTAYVNRKGMLITDSKEQKINPIAPRGKSLWPDYAVVVVPTTDRGDEWIRTMESASHDSMSSGQLQEEKEQREAERVFRKIRECLRDCINEAAQIEKYGDISNLNELAAMFPDEFDPDSPANRVLQTHTIETTVPQISLEDSGPDDGGGIQNNATGDTAQQTRKERKKKEEDKEEDPKRRQANTNRPDRAPGLNRARLIPKDATHAMVAFTFNEEEPRQIRLALTPVGSEAGRENRVDIVEVRVVNPDGLEVSLDSGVLSLTPNPGQRPVLEITANGRIDDKAFRLG